MIRNYNNIFVKTILKKEVKLCSTSLELILMWIPHQQKNKEIGRLPEIPEIPEINAATTQDRTPIWGTINQIRVLFQQDPLYYIININKTSQ
jgi:hypothetical protein